MTNREQIERELNALALAYCRVREGRRSCNYREAIEAIEAARAHAQAVLGHLDAIATEIGTRDLTEELAESVERVSGKGAA